MLGSGMHNLNLTLNDHRGNLVSPVPVLADEQVFLQDVEVGNMSKASLDLGQLKVVKGLITLEHSIKVASELVVGKKIAAKRRG
jgi:hypothetical protein